MISALELSRQLGVKYDTAWAIKHKLMAAMQDRNKAYKLKGDVQIDDAYLGGEGRGRLAAELRARPPLRASSSRPSEARGGIAKEHELQCVRSRTRLCFSGMTAPRSVGAFGKVCSSGPEGVFHLLGRLRRRDLDRQIGSVLKFVHDLPE